MREWEEEELPSPEELMPLSQTLITADLALAFDIPTDNNRAEAIPNAPSSTLKKPRLVWTPQLHKLFVEAVAHLGIKNAVHKTIMQLMNVDGLTRENVASHFQKYRLYLKRTRHSSASAASSATDRLFASGPVPSQLPRPFVPVTAMQQYQQMAAAAAVHQNQYYNHQMQRMGMLRPPPYAEELRSGEQKERKVLTLFPED